MNRRKLQVDGIQSQGFTSVLDPNSFCWGSLWTLAASGCSTPSKSCLQFQYGIHQHTWVRGSTETIWKPCILWLVLNQTPSHSLLVKMLSTLEVMFSSILEIIMPSKVFNISIGREWKGVWFNTSHGIHGFHIVSEDPLTQVCWYIPYWNCRHDLLGVEQPETAKVQREPQQKLFGSNTPVKPWLWIPSTCNLRLFICFRSTDVCSCNTTSVEG